MIADQALSSASNIATGVVAARVLDRRAFGAFGLAFVLYTLVIGITRAAVTEPLVSLYSRRDPEALRPTIRAASGSALGLGIPIAGVVGMVGLGVGGIAWTSLGGLALVLPGLVLQDAWRYCFVVSGRPRAAVFNDATWCAIQAAVLVVLISISHLTLLTIILWWGGSGAAAGLVGCVQAAMVPTPGSTQRWIRHHRQLSWRYTTEFVVATGSSQLTLIALGAIAGLAALGSIRGAMVFFGPIVVLFGGAYLALGAEGARLAAEPHRLRRLMAYSSVLLFIVALVSLLVGAALPAHIGRIFFGATWSPAQHVLVPVGLSVLGNCVAAGAIVGLRALAAAQASLRGRLIAAPVAVVAPLVGAASGSRGFAMGMAVASWVGALIWWRQFSRALNHAVPEATQPRGTGDGG